MSADKHAEEMQRIIDKWTADRAAWVKRGLADEAAEVLASVRAEKIDHLYCGHCGGIEDVRSVDFREGNTRHLCRPCRVKILEWI